MGPLAQSDGHDPPRLIDELVPSIATVVDDVVEGFEDSVREPVVAHELPDVFLRVQLRAFCRQCDERDVGRNDQAAGEMPAGLIDEQRGVRARRDLGWRFQPGAGSWLRCHTEARRGQRPCRPWGRLRRIYKRRRFADLWERSDAFRAWPNGG